MNELPFTTRKIRLLLVDDHAAIRVGLMTVAGDEPDMEVVADVGNGEEAIAACHDRQPDVVILDLRLPGIGAIETIRRLREEFKSIRILVFTNHAKAAEILRATNAGAAGFVLKAMPLARLLEAIRAVHRGRNYIPPEIAAHLGGWELPPLSPRETEILGLLAKGLANREIAARLGVVEGTVKLHITGIFNKLDVSDRTQALIAAVKRGLVQIEGEPSVPFLKS
jgi:DNA-binding NarL/FixJ family response regulator